MLFDLMRRPAGAKDSQITLQYMSDLHLERIKYDYTITRAAANLVLSGDIGRFCDYDQYRDCLEKQCAQFEIVLFVAGNHEFYGSSRESGLDAASKLVEEPCMNGRLRFLNRTRIDLSPEVTVLGCTLQSHIPDDYTKLTNDFARIQDWRVADHNAEHRLDVDWLIRSLEGLSQETPRRRVVIVTHYSPSFEKTCHPLNENNAVSPCFSSNMLQELPTWSGADLITHWIFGHTHWNASFKAGKTNVLSNQLCNDSQRLSWWQKKTMYRPFDPKATLQI